MKSNWMAIWTDDADKQEHQGKIYHVDTEDQALALARADYGDPVRVVRQLGPAGQPAPSQVPAAEPLHLKPEHEPKGTQRRRVYLAGPLSSPDCCLYLANVASMMRHAEILRNMGFAVFNPAHDLLAGIQAKEPMEYRDYMDNNMPWVEVAEAIFLCPGWQGSGGSTIELARATERGIPSFTSFEDIKAWRDKQ